VTLAILCGLAGCGAQMPDWQAPLEYRPSEVIPLHFTPRRLPCVRASIDGHPVQLGLDTGDMAGLPIAPRVADRLGLRTAGRGDFHDSDGRQAGSRREFRVRSLQALGSAWLDQPARESARVDPPGLIGPRYLVTGRFTLDYSTSRLAVSARPWLQARGIGVGLPLVRSPRSPGMLVVRGVADGESVLVQIDTGKNRTRVDPALARRARLEPTENGVRIRELLLARGVAFFVAPAKVVGFFGISQDLPAPIEVGIGADVLSKLLVTADYRRRVIRLAVR
jgi:hypothetical protein